MQDTCESLLDSPLLPGLQGTCSQGCHRFGELWGEVPGKEDTQKSSPQGRPGAAMEAMQELGTGTKAGGQGGVRTVPSLPAEGICEDK